jgi:hypothetical protein
MAYTTTGTVAFNLDLNNLIEEAFERCGQELRSGYDMRTARRSLNLMTLEWANRGLNMWTVEQGQIVLATGQSTYALPTDTIDLLDRLSALGQIPTRLTSISAGSVNLPSQQSPTRTLREGRFRSGSTVSQGPQPSRRLR